MLTHHVFFWLHNSGSAEDRRKLMEGVQGLAAIPTVRALHAGTPAPTEQREVVDSSWDVCELMHFDSAEDQQVYQDHPLHRRFIQEYGHLWRKVIVYDSVSGNP